MDHPCKQNIYVFLIQIRLKGEVGTFLLFVFVSAILSCLFLAALWTLLALLYVVFLCFVTFPYVVLDRCGT